MPGNFHSALNVLADRATYFYTGQGKYWYDLQANITRSAKDQARAAAPARTSGPRSCNGSAGQGKTRGDFAGVHVCPDDSGDIADHDEARLVILHPKVAHKRRAQDSDAMAFAKAATETKGTREPRPTATCSSSSPPTRPGSPSSTQPCATTSGGATSWTTRPSSISASTRRTRPRSGASRPTSTSAARLLQTFVWALVPEQPDPTAPFTMRETKIEGQSPALAERVSRKLGNDGVLSTRQAAATIRLAIQRVPQIWAEGHVALGDLWKLMGTYPYMPRLRDRKVLDEGVLDMPMIWQTDAFALATAYDATAGRYVGLWSPSGSSAPPGR